MSNVHRLILTPRLHEVRFSPRVACGLRGDIEVAKFDRAGRRVPVRVNRHRRAFQRVWDHRQENLITDAGLDYGIGNSSEFAFSSLLSYLAVGTGSATPAVTDTALASELARTNATLGLGSDELWTQVSTGVGSLTRVRTFDYGQANGNLTEFGGSSGVSPATILTRGLFVDELDAPTVITKTSDEQLRITYTLTNTVTGPSTLTATSDVTFTGLGTFSVDWMQYIEAAAGGGSSFPMGLWRAVAPVFRLPESGFPTTYASTGAGTLADGVTNVSARGLGAFLTYTGGSFERAVQGTWPTTASDETIQGIVLGGGYATSGFSAYWGWRFTSPVSLTKEAEYRLVLNATLAVSRA